MYNSGAKGLIKFRSNTGAHKHKALRIFTYYFRTSRSHLVIQSKLLSSEV